MVNMIDLKVFPPPEDMFPNVFIIVKIPEYIYNDFLDYATEQIKEVIFSVAEQEINIHTIHNVKVSVIIESVRETVSRKRST